MDRRDADDAITLRLSPSARLPVSYRPFLLTLVSGLVLLASRFIISRYAMDVTEIHLTATLSILTPVLPHGAATAPLDADGDLAETGSVHKP